MNGFDLAVLTAAGIGVGLSLAALFDVRLVSRKLDAIEHLFNHTRHEVSEVHQRVRKAEQATDDVAAGAEMLRSLGDSSSLLEFLSSSGAVDEPRPDGFVQIYNPGEEDANGRSDD